MPSVSYHQDLRTPYDHTTPGERVMPSWITDLFKPEVLGVIAVIVFLIFLLVKVWPVLSRFVTLVNVLTGDDDTPGIAKRMDAQTKKLDAITEKQHAQDTLLERVRNQVENDHTQNFRDDLDSVSAKLDAISLELREHVSISKVKDSEATETAYRVAVLADKVNKIHPVIERLGINLQPGKG